MMPLVGGGTIRLSIRPDRSGLWVAVGPGKRRHIDDARQPMHAVGLVGRARIRKRSFPIDDESIVDAGFAWSRGRPPAAVHAAHGPWLIRIDQVHRLGLQRPDRKDFWPGRRERT